MSDSTVLGSFTARNLRSAWDGAWKGAARNLREVASASAAMTRDMSQGRIPYGNIHSAASAAHMYIAKLEQLQQLGSVIEADSDVFVMSSEFKTHVPDNAANISGRSDATQGITSAASDRSDPAILSERSRSVLVVALDNAANLFKDAEREELRSLIAQGHVYIPERSEAYDTAGEDPGFTDDCAQRSETQGAAKCSDCGWPFAAMPADPRSIRSKAQHHVLSTGHAVNVTVSDVTQYRPAGGSV